ncbi:DUF418 domain-containing protein [Gracilibacillus alcaliphilus]|uniref:DUF418 domain-containing protein n=1 Tax=Gracilibacillus alcaliphilus TaxID=1401441 RepID=UPI00195AEE15|nr:DUF418 domain-containing protein [Gracilibacillus alcaliphilus]MBM7675434.1 uncharacterized protein [Gracilibacillus alcaliphilus]
MNQPMPLQETKRLPWIDSARGFAILGIFMVNLPSFHGPYFLYGNGQNYWGLGEPGLVHILIDIFFQASFYSLFSFLFGFGMYIIYENLKHRQVEVPYKWLVRRQIILLVIGVLHAFLIWHGDILITYALIGLLLLLFLKRKDITLWIWGACLLLIPTMLMTGLLFLASQLEDLGSIANTAGIEQSYQHYGAGNIADILQQNLTDWLYSNNLFQFIFITCNILPIFLLGVLFARKKWLHDIQQHKKILHIWWGVSLGLFVIFKAGPYLAGNPIWLQLLQDTIGGISSAVFYLLTITLLYNKAVKFFQYIGCVGKMALSNYIYQSIISFIIFYSVGFSLYGKLTPLQTVLIGLGVYLIQTIVSYWWLKHYQRGPIEWLWRSLLYKKKLANKRTG